ncbi:MAG: hypothetical protein E7214_12835 [Clostridium sp.]|nr:hypothetical protein [Clostridium sp.]
MNKNFKRLVIRILEDIGKGNTLKCNKYSISEECFGSMLDFIRAKDLARGMCVVRSNTIDNVRVFGYMNPYLTTNGVNYINKNL